MTVELLPDDGFRIGYAALGKARLVWTSVPIVLVTVATTDAVDEVTARLGEILDPELERRVYVE